MGQYYAAIRWVHVSCVLLVAYIGTGLYALRLGRTRGIRAACLVAALLLYCQIISIAITHDARGLLRFAQEPRQWTSRD